MLPPRYDVQQAIDAERLRTQERHFSHIRVLKSETPRVSLVGQLAGWLASLGAAFRRPGPMRQRAAGICRLADGSTGRVVMRRVGNKWIEVCVGVSEASAPAAVPPQSN